MTSCAKTGFRTDIQALRGFAVLLVVFYHSGLGVVVSGFLGVDLFFVISGYLITGIIAHAIVAERFSFAEFYARRARRLLPAAYVVLFITTFASAAVLTSDQFALYRRTLAASLVFAANFSLWAQTGYFAPNAAFNPLLHLWSLAIEEQYYLLVPLLLTLLPRRWWGVVLTIATVSSLAACLYFATTRPSVAFFWLPPRAWELGLGSLAALSIRNARLVGATRRLIIPAVLVIALVPFVTLPGPTPGLGAILICLAGAIIVLARDERADRQRWLVPLARVGDFSYSLYLVHWPLFALSRVPRLSVDLPIIWSLGLMMLSVAGGWLLYRFVEEPWRSSRATGSRLVLAALSSSALLLLVAWGLGAVKPSADPEGVLSAPVLGLAGPDCFEADPDHYSGRCSQSPNPQILLWGDSYGAHLMPGLIATTRRPIAQATKGHCTPLVDVAAVVEPNELAFSRRCLAYNASVLEFVRDTPSIRVVVLSGQYLRFLPEKSAFAIRRQGTGSIRSPLGLGALIAAQRETVVALRRLGRRVIVVSPPPPAQFDVGQCWLRRAEGLLLADARSRCALRQANPERTAQSYDAMLTAFEQVSHVPVVHLDEVLCHGANCDIESGGKPLFRDDGHLTTWGSIIVGQRLDLGARAWSFAS